MLRLSNRVRNWTIGILVAGFAVVAFIIRAVLPFQYVFEKGWIKFTSIDAYYQMIVVDNMVRHFPGLSPFSPYLLYGGASFGDIHFFNWIIAAVVWVLGLGHPSEHLINSVAVFIPVVMAAITVVLMYFLGKNLFNKWVGLGAAILLAVMPGEYLGRSILGFTDTHVAEVLLTTASVLFLVMAINTAEKRNLSLDSLRHPDWTVLRRPLIYTLLAGLFMGLYLITWLGGLLFVFIITVVLALQIIINHVHKKSSAILGAMGALVFLVSLIILVPFSPSYTYNFTVVIAVVLPLVLVGLSILFKNSGLNPWYYPLALVGAGVVFLVLLRFVSPETFHWVYSQFSIFAPSGASATTTMEMQPFLSPSGTFSTAVAWGNFTTSFFLVSGVPIPGFALITIPILVVLAFRNRGTDIRMNLLIIWSIVMLILTLQQRRFAYYFVVDVSLLSAYIAWQIVQLVGAKRIAAESARAAATAAPVANSGSTTFKASAKGGGGSGKTGNKTTSKVPGTARRKPNRRRTHTTRTPSFSIYHVWVTVTVIVLALVLVLPNILQSTQLAGSPQFGPTNAWEDSLTWLRYNSPEPMGTNPDAYYASYAAPAPGQQYALPSTAYAVTSWWDYGYWITRIGHRMPNANPSQQPGPITNIANLFTSDNQTQINALLGKLGTKYVISDNLMTTSKYWAMVTWANKNLQNYEDTYYVYYQNSMRPLTAYYPDYYQSMLVRLYNFNGQAVTNVKPVVITYSNEKDSKGQSYKQITNISDNITSYADAVQTLQSLEASKPNDNTFYRIVSFDPFTSPVPLNSVPGMTLVHSSADTFTSGNQTIPDVKIFEYKP